QAEHGPCEIPAHIRRRKVKLIRLGYRPTEEVAGKPQIGTQISRADEVISALCARDRSRDLAQRRLAGRGKPASVQIGAVYGALGQPVPPSAHTGFGRLECDDLVLSHIDENVLAHTRPLADIARHLREGE